MAAKRTKATGRAPQPAAEVRLGGPTKKARKMFKSPQRMAEEIKLQKAAFQLLARGLNYTQIAEQLGIGHKRACRIGARALDEALADKGELVHLYMAKSIIQSDSLIRTWMPRALGGIKTNRRGEAVLGDDGEPIVVEPDEKAAMIVARVIRDRNILIGYGVSQKVEHTGAGGGPIMTAHLDARAAAALFRESNVNAPQVFLDEGESIDDVPTLAAQH